MSPDKSNTDTAAWLSNSNKKWQHNMYYIFAWQYLPRQLETVSLLKLTEQSSTSLRVLLCLCILNNIKIIEKHNCTKQSNCHILSNNRCPLAVCSGNYKDVTCVNICFLCFKSIQFMQSSCHATHIHEDSCASDQYFFTPSRWKKKYKQSIWLTCLSLG